MSETKATDTQYEDGRLVSVRPHDEGYEIEFEDRGWLFIPDPGFEPKPGDQTRSYGKGMGFTVRGLDINGREVYYRTEEEDRVRTQRMLDESERKRREHLESKGGVSPDPGTGKYDWREDMGEISGFGGTYEAACRAMLIRTLEFWDEQGEGFDPKYHGFKDITGICINDNEDAKRLDEAMMDAEIVYGDGERSRVGDGASGAMHQAVVSHAFFVRQNGWEEYAKRMRERG